MPGCSKEDLMRQQRRRPLRLAVTVSRSPSSPPPVAAAAGEARSAELGNQIDQQLTADMATIPLYAKPTYLAVRDRFTNVGDNATQEGPFWNSGLWARRRPSRSPGVSPGETLSRAGGWLGDLPGASRMVAAPAAAQAAPRDDAELEEPT
jgi:hypothetical protein